VFSSWSRFLIGRDGDSERLDATSPARNAYRIKCPVLLLHGSADITVRVEQSEVMDSALRSAGKNVEFIKLDGETHFMEASATRIRVLTELEKFLKANIGN
jgi:dipeptidyl aminopeptidase/acylaminoacyl peptidase